MNKWRSLAWVGIALAGLVGVYLTYLTGLFFLQRSLLYPGVTIPVAATPPVVPGLEQWRIQTPIGAVEALFLAASTASSAARQPVLIFAHGNGEVVDFWVSGLNGFRERGIGVLLVEYPGYGRSTGAPSESSIRIAMTAAYDRLLADARVDSQRILGFGQSLGGGAVCLLARERPLRALILQSTFPSLAVFASQYFAPSFLLRDRFDNAATLRIFAGPVLVIHGRYDGLIPLALGRRLAAASPRSTFRAYACGHVCWMPERLPLWADIDIFLAQAEIR